MKPELTVSPSEPVTKTVAVIAVGTGSVCVSFPEKHEDFRLLVKRLGYSWSGLRWERGLNPKYNGTPEDRAAELGRKLLAAKFIVEFPDEAIKAAALNGDYQPEYTRWVMAAVGGNFNGWFRIKWSRGDDFYRDAMQLPGARYDATFKMVCIPPQFYAEVVDFASINGFMLSDGARKICETTSENYLAVLLADIDPSDMPEVRQQKPPLPDSGQGIADEFLDDPL